MSEKNRGKKVKDRMQLGSTSWVADLDCIRMGVCPTLSLVLRKRVMSKIREGKAQGVFVLAVAQRTEAYSGGQNVLGLGIEALFLPVQCRNGHGLKEAGCIKTSMGIGKIGRSVGRRIHIQHYEFNAHYQRTGTL